MGPQELCGSFPESLGELALSALMRAIFANSEGNVRKQITAVYQQHSVMKYCTADPRVSFLWQDLNVYLILY